MLLQRTIAEHEEEKEYLLQELAEALLKTERLKGVKHHSIILQCFNMNRQVLEHNKAIEEIRKLRAPRKTKAQKEWEASRSR